MSDSRAQARSALGGLVRRRREDRGFSLREAARRIGISPGYLSAIESGRNPTTGRPPTPSPRILAAVERVLGVDMPTLLAAAGAGDDHSVHVLLYQRGEAGSPLAAARALFAGRVDGWIEVVDPAATPVRRPRDVLASRRGPLGVTRAGGAFASARALDELDELLAAARTAHERTRLGLVFGATSALLSSAGNPGEVIASEATWETAVAARVEAAVGVGPTANVCVYRDTALQRLAPRLDVLDAVVSLLAAHPLVAVQDPAGGLETGNGAVETILGDARPAGVREATWNRLARAAAAGFGVRGAVCNP